METKVLYSTIAELMIAMNNCDKSGNNEWFDKHQERIEQLIKEFMPSGSGWDNGTKIDFDASNANKLVFYGSFHHMDQNGYYDGWTDHSVIVTPSLAWGFNLRITGRNRNDIKEYLDDLFATALQTDITEYMYRSIKK